MPLTRRLVFALAVLLIGVAQVVTPHVGSDRPYRSPGALPTFTASATVLLAVGDIGTCDDTNDDSVAALAKRMPGAIALLGDDVYPDGGLADYESCFDPAWGPLRARIHPAQGNHDFESSDASGYYDYFGAAAGTAHEGWYSYDVGSWHLIALNSDCPSVGGCGDGSPQLAWLTADLQTRSARAATASSHSLAHPSHRPSCGPTTHTGCLPSTWAPRGIAGSSCRFQVTC